MRVSKFRDIFQSLELQTHIADFDYLDIIQQVVNEIFADDVIGRLVKPAPDISTTAGTLTYPFATLLPSNVETNGDSLVRKVRGIWEPELTPASTINDYGRGRTVPVFNQDDLNQRVYNGDAHVDNELRQIVFNSDPGTTTDKWKIDFWLKAPTLTEDDELPILPGWERRLLLQGGRAWFEELDDGQAGTQGAIFEQMIEKYRDAVNRDTRLDNRTDDLGFDVGGTFVQAQ